MLYCNNLHAIAVTCTSVVENQLSFGFQNWLDLTDTIQWDHFKGESMIGLLSAMVEETERFRNNLQTTNTSRVGNVSFYSGALNGSEIVLGSCGVGKVNAAAAAQAMIDHFSVSHIIFTGLAGSLVSHLKRGDVVVSSFVGQHDFDLTAFGKRPGQVGDSERLIEADANLVRLATQAFDRVYGNSTDRQLVVGTIVTGDSFIADKTRLAWIHREFGAVAAEMEGAAVGEVCRANNVPFAVIRVISDSASNAAAGEFIMFLDEASETTYQIVAEMLPSVGKRHTTCTSVIQVV